MNTDIFSYTIAVCYICYIYWLWRSWKKAEVYPFKTGEKKNGELISIVVAFKNEQKNLEKLQKAIECQTYKNYELILVNDHSTDDFEKEIKQNKQTRILNAVGKGKKNALREGIAIAKGEIVLCTDADCLPCPTWVECVASAFDKTNADMVLAPVVMLPDKSAFQRMQTLEFSSLQATTAGTACANSPIMSNGANMAFRKNIWTELSDGICDKEISGDDVFMLHQFKKAKRNIQYLKSQNGIVFTYPCSTLKDFFNQRMRWASKSKSYKDAHSIFAALTVFLVCIALLANAVGAFFNIAYLVTFGVIFILKLIIDRIFLWSYGSFSRETYLTVWIFPLSLIYPFYIVISAIGGLMGCFSWKK